MSKRAHKRKTALPQPAAGSGQWAGFLVLVGAVMVSACGVVWTTHKSRLLLNELQQLETSRNLLQVEWGRLLLEQSSLVSQGRIEDRAITELEMVAPNLEKVVVVKGG